MLLASTVCTIHRDSYFCMNACFNYRDTGCIACFDPKTNLLIYLLIKKLFNYN
jgi:hypothetical protein